GIVGLVLALLLLRPLTAGSRMLVVSLLRGGEGVTPEPSQRERRHSLAMHATAYVVVNLALTLIWALTSRGYFWPAWAVLALGLALAVHAASELATEQVPPARRSLAVHGGATVAASVFFTLIWAVTSRGYFWPVWPILVLALAFIAHAIAEFGRRGRRITELE